LLIEGGCRGLAAGGILTGHFIHIIRSFMQYLLFLFISAIIMECRKIEEA
jgi:hypothetical protein